MMDSSIENSNNFADSSDASHLKELYQELAEKDKALIMAAEYGKNLVDEKEELERQIDSLKRDHQNEIENLEQELYKLKRLLESMRNEYDNKVYELNEDINILNRRLLQQKDQNSQSKYRCSDDDDDDFEDIDELKEKNKKYLNELKSNEMKLTLVHENCQILESKLAEKENIINENAKLINNFQKEMSKVHGKQQELEFVLMQTCNERDKQAKIIEELTQKLLTSENEKHEIEHWAYQQETELINLQRINQDLIFKLDKLNYNTNSASKTDLSNNRKRRSLSNTPSSCPMHMTLFSTRAPDSATNTPNFGQSFIKKSVFSDQFNNRSYFDAEFDDVDENNDTDMFRINEIEQDDDEDNAIVYLRNGGFIDEDHDESIEAGGVNWLTEVQEAIEQRLIDDDNSVGDSGDDKERESHEEESTQESTSISTQQPVQASSEQQPSSNENGQSEDSSNKSQEMN